nr:AAA family ATPase [Kibdelosporangium sp. MJ126-NF4]
MRIIGRDTELAALRAALDSAQGMVLLRGEAGIGKSRLAGQALETAAERGMTVLRAQAHPLQAGLAYGPIVDAIRPHADAFGEECLGRLLAYQEIPARLSGRRPGSQPHQVVRRRGAARAEPRTGRVLRRRPALGRPGHSGTGALPRPQRHRRARPRRVPAR